MPASSTARAVRRYSAPEFVSAEKRIVVGAPDVDLISTSYIERLNATVSELAAECAKLRAALAKSEQQRDEYRQVIDQYDREKYEKNEFKEKDNSYVKIKMKCKEIEVN